MLKQHILDTYILTLFYYITYNPVHYELVFESSVATNFRYGHCLHVNFDTVRLFSGVALNKCTSCNLITSANMVADLRIEGYFSHSITMTSCIAYPPRLLRLYCCIWCHINLSNLSELHHFTIWSNPIIYIYIYIYICV